jgi:hypothetical protein
MTKSLRKKREKMSEFTGVKIYVPAYLIRLA